jgi:hypothetical protein
MRPARRAAIAALCAGLAGGAATAGAHTTRESRILPVGPGPFRALATAPGEGWVVREEGVGVAQPGRAERRRSLLYFSQLTDFQLADEESPARVEYLDRGGPPFVSAWRPMEALGAQTIHAAVRRLNALADRSPVASAGDRRARMAFALVTGDNADNHQLNETQWVVRLLEGGRLQPNSGTESPAVYTGVQDPSDTPLPDPYYYDPDSPAGDWAAWPRYPGLLDRAQQAFETPGLKVPSYVAFGNHDASFQGTQSTNAAFEAVAVGDLKLFGAGLAAPVPPDPARQFVDKVQYKAVYRTAASPDAHGFGLVDPEEESASRGAAGYYAWSPRPGLRFIALDTICEATSIARPGPAEGNLDDAQFRWLERQLRNATAADELIVLFSHHAIPSLRCDVPDEEVPCTFRDAHGHDVNPGCDLDPRRSTPLHLGLEVKELILRYPHVIAWVAGHTHNNVVEAYRAAGGTGFWSIRLASEIDWPQHSRLIEILDNQDGTLSIFGTIVDHAAPPEIPASGAGAGSFTPLQLASISRTLAANDPQVQAGETRPREGFAKDRNVELLVRDPRRRPPPRCAGVGGRIAGVGVAAARLGAKRATIRRAFPSRRTRGRFDEFCLANGSRVRAGYPTRRLLAALGPRERRRVRGRAVVILSSNRGHGARGVRPRDRAGRLRGKAAFTVRIGAATWHVARGRRAQLVFVVRGARVREVGLADGRLARTRRGARLLFGGA